jgi:hypothetical protein
MPVIHKAANDKNGAEVKPRMIVSNKKRMLNKNKTVESFI